MTLFFEDGDFVPADPDLEGQDLSNTEPASAPDAADGIETDGAAALAASPAENDGAEQQAEGKEESVSDGDLISHLEEIKTQNYAMLFILGTIALYLLIDGLFKRP